MHSERIVKVHSLFSCMINTCGATWIPLNYSAGTGLFVDCFYPTAGLKIEQLKNTCLIDLKVSSKIELYKNIHVKFCWKRPSMREVIWTYTMGCRNFLGRLSALLATCSNNSPMYWEQCSFAQFEMNNLLSSWWIELKFSQKNAYCLEEHCVKFWM